MSLWNNDTEIQFFTECLSHFASPEQLFYRLRGEYYAYIPNNFDSEGNTLQSRNSLIGSFTEKWCKTLFEPIAKHFGLYAVNNVVCKELSLPQNSNADLAFCTSPDVNQNAANIKLIFEIKMSIISNYKYENSNILFLGDYKQHEGKPSLLRSDSMLKAIGKAINIRVSGSASTKIPIVVLGNSPISENYKNKVDFLKTSGVVQGFWSLNPNPTSSQHVVNSNKLGFQTIFNENTLYDLCNELLSNDMNYFSSMISKPELGKIIRIANEEKDDISKAEKFLTLINS